MWSKSQMYKSCCINKVNTIVSPQISSIYKSKVSEKVSLNLFSKQLVFFWGGETVLFAYMV